MDFLIVATCLFFFMTAGISGQYLFRKDMSWPKSALCFAMGGPFLWIIGLVLAAVFLPFGLTIWVFEKLFGEIDAL